MASESSTSCADCSRERNTTRSGGLAQIPRSRSTYSTSTTISRGLHVNADEDRPTDAMSSRVPGPDEEGPDPMASRA